MAQLYGPNWIKIGAAKTPIPNVTSTKCLDISPTLDDGVFLIRSILNGSTYTRSVRRLNAALVQAGPDYAFPAANFDFVRVAAPSATHAVVLFRNTVSY